MSLIKRLDDGTEIWDKRDSHAEPGAGYDDATRHAAACRRVTNRISSRRHKTERTIAVLLICAGVMALAAGSIVGSALLLSAGVSLYLHSRVIALWSDED